MTPVRTESLERAGYITLVACFAIDLFKIYGADLLPLAAIFWLIVAFREKRPLDVPAFFWPLVVLAGWTLLSAAFGVNPLESFKRSRQLLFFLIVPGTMRLLRGDRAATTMNVIIAAGAVSAMVGVVEYVALGFDDMSHRPPGTFGHYMTYSGLLMLVLCSVLAKLIFNDGRWIWPAIAVPALLAALVFTESRNAWVGTALAVAVLLAMRNWRLLLVMPVLAAALFFVAPKTVQSRILSVVDLNDPTNRDRVAMFKSGVHMTRDHPLFGVGLNNVMAMYPKYREPDAVDPEGTIGIGPRAHLHNVPVQLAAERGLPALAAWLWFVVVAGRELFTQLRHGPSKALAGAGVAALIGMLVAGLFEHNFGDSEFLMLFLGLITLPFAARNARL